MIQQKFRAIVNQKVTERTQIFEVIVSGFRRYIDTHNINVLKLVKVRRGAAALIQSWIRGNTTRGVMKELRPTAKHPVITYKYSALGVYIIGNFTDPPFETKIPMKYHKTTNLFYSRYFMENDVLPGIYKLKFVVDGESLCDGNLPIN
jgi:hypothetical protein